MIKTPLSAQYWSFCVCSFPRLTPAKSVPMIDIPIFYLAHVKDNPLTFCVIQRKILVHNVKVSSKMSHKGFLSFPCASAAIFAVIFNVKSIQT